MKKTDVILLVFTGFFVGVAVGISITSHMCTNTIKEIHKTYKISLEELEKEYKKSQPNPFDPLPENVF